MQTTTVNLTSVGFKEWKTYLMASLFIAGNVVLPQLCHLVPQGGLHWLPIYFFTLIGAYRYGWRVGLLTAVASPLVNSALFGMPAVEVLPAIMLKSVLLALCASLMARRTGAATVLSLLAVVVAYQSLGTIGEWIIGASWTTALQDVRIGLPGLAVQVFGGWAVLNWAAVKKHFGR